MRMLDARTRSAGGKTRKSIAIPTGVMSPPPMPCMTRKRTSSPRFWASPHSADAIVKIDDRAEEDFATAETVP